MEAIDEKVRVEVYRAFLADGRPPVPAEIGIAIGADQQTVEGSLRRLADDHLLVLAPGTPYVWMANPLSAIPTPFAVEADGRRYFGNCVWDALGVLAMVGVAGTVRTWCPCCGERLAVEVCDDRLVDGEGVVHFERPAA